MNLKSILLSVLMSVGGINGVMADSPLTSTPFYKAYMDIDGVAHAKENGLDAKTLKFLCKKKVDPMHKFAAINAIGWGNEENVKNFENYLLKKTKKLDDGVFDYLRTVSDNKPEETNQTEMLTADELTCWAYLQTMGDYFNPAKGMRAGYLGAFRDEESMAHMVPFTLLAAQKVFDSSWCRVYEIPYSMLVKAEYSKNIILDEALKIIMDYINLYKESCDE